MFALPSPILPPAGQSGRGSLNALPDELVAFHSGSEACLLFATHHFADAAQAHLGTRAGGLGERDQVLNRRAYFDGHLGCEQHSARTHVAGFALGFVLDLAGYNFEGKAQVEALVFSLFRHSDTEFIERTK